mgnify:CR=1 FL=1
MILKKKKYASPSIAVHKVKIEATMMAASGETTINNSDHASGKVIHVYEQKAFFILFPFVLNKTLNFIKTIFPFNLNTYFCLN